MTELPANLSPISGCAGVPPAKSDTSPISELTTPAPATPAETPTTIVTVDEMRDALKDIYDPEIPINIVDLGLIYNLVEKDGAVTVDMTLTSPHCPLSEQIKARVIYALSILKGVKIVNVNFVFEPMWTKENMTFEGRLQASMLGFL